MDKDLKEFDEYQEELNRNQREALAEVRAQIQIMQDLCEDALDNIELLQK